MHTSLTNIDYNQFIKHIDYAQFGSCMIVAEILTKKLLEVGEEDFKVVEGWVWNDIDAYPSEHTWIEKADGTKIDPSFVQFKGIYDYYEGTDEEGKKWERKEYTPQEYLELCKESPVDVDKYRLDKEGKKRKKKKIENVAIPPELKKKLKGVSLGKDKDGYLVYTHRARSKSYESPHKIPLKDIKFIESTGSMKLSWKVNPDLMNDEQLEEYVLKHLSYSDINSVVVLHVSRIDRGKFSPSYLRFTLNQNGEIERDGESFFFMGDSYSFNRALNLARKTSKETGIPIYASKEFLELQRLQVERDSKGKKYSWKISPSTISIEQLKEYVKEHFKPDTLERAGEYATALTISMDWTDHFRGERVGFEISSDGNLVVGRRHFITSTFNSFDSVLRYLGEVSKKTEEPIYRGKEYEEAERVQKARDWRPGSKLSWKTDHSIERGDNVKDLVLDWEMPKEIYYGIYDAKVEREYTPTEAIEKAAEFETYGPWHGIDSKLSWAQVLVPEEARFRELEDEHWKFFKASELLVGLTNNYVSLSIFLNELTDRVPGDPIYINIESYDKKIDTSEVEWNVDDVFNKLKILKETYRNKKGSINNLSWAIEPEVLKVGDKVKYIGRYPELLASQVLNKENPLLEYLELDREYQRTRQEDIVNTLQTKVGEIVVKVGDVNKVKYRGSVNHFIISASNKDLQKVPDSSNLYNLRESLLLNESPRDSHNNNEILSNSNSTLSWKIVDSLKFPKQGMVIYNNLTGNEGVIVDVDDKGPFGEYIVEWDGGEREEYEQPLLNERCTFIRWANREELASKYDITLLPGDRVQMITPPDFWVGPTEGVIIRGGSKGRAIDIFFGPDEGEWVFLADNFKIIEPNPRYGSIAKEGWAHVVTFESAISNIRSQGFSCELESIDPGGKEVWEIKKDIGKEVKTIEELESVTAEIFDIQRFIWDDNLNKVEDFVIKNMMSSKLGKVHFMSQWQSGGRKGYRTSVYDLFNFRPLLEAGDIILDIGLFSTLFSIIPSNLETVGWKKRDFKLHDLVRFRKNLTDKEFEKLAGPLVPLTTKNHTWVIVDVRDKNYFLATSMEGGLTYTNISKDMVYEVLDWVEDEEGEDITSLSWAQIGPEQYVGWLVRVDVDYIGPTGKRREYTEYAVITESTGSKTIWGINANTPEEAKKLYLEATPGMLKRNTNNSQVEYYRLDQGTVTPIEQIKKIRKKTWKIPRWRKIKNKGELKVGDRIRIKKGVEESSRSWHMDSNENFTVIPELTEGVIRSLKNTTQLHIITANTVGVDFDNYPKLHPRYTGWAININNIEKLVLSNEDNDKLSWLTLNIGDVLEFKEDITPDDFIETGMEYIGKNEEVFNEVVASEWEITNIYNKDTVYYLRMLSSNKNLSVKRDIVYKFMRLLDTPVSYGLPVTDKLSWYTLSPSEKGDKYEMHDRVRFVGDIKSTIDKAVEKGLPEQVDESEPRKRRRNRLIADMYDALSGIGEVTAIGAYGQDLISVKFYGIDSNYIFLLSESEIEFVRRVMSWKVPPVINYKEWTEYKRKHPTESYVWLEYEYGEGAEGWSVRIDGDSRGRNLTYEEAKANARLYADTYDLVYVISRSELMYATPDQRESSKDKVIPKYSYVVNKEGKLAWKVGDYIYTLLYQSVDTTNSFREGSGWEDEEIDGNSLREIIERLVTLWSENKVAFVSEVFRSRVDNILSYELLYHGDKDTWNTKYLTPEERDYIKQAFAPIKESWGNIRFEKY